MNIGVNSRQISPWRIRAGSRSRTEPKPGLNQTKAKTSAVNPTTIRINPGIARKPKRRSSLSNQFIAAHGKGTRPRFKVDQPLRRANNGMQKCPLALENAIHEHANGLGDGEEKHEIDYYLRDTE